MSSHELQNRNSARARGALRTRIVAAAAMIVLASALTIASTPAAAQAETAKGVWNWFMGKGGQGQRNADDRERILSVLTHKGYVSVRGGRVEINNNAALSELYASLREAGTLKRMPQYADDPDNRNAGTFWRSFLDGKDHLDRDLPASMDQFANNNSGLATAMHGQLQVDSIDYADTAATLHSRGIDVMDTELRRGVATGANVMIQSLNALTGGTSGQAVKWMEEAAAAAGKAQGDPTGAAKGYLKDHIRDALQEIVDDKIKSAMGEGNYEKIMDRYKSYGDKQERLKAFMDDMYAKTGDARFKDASELLNKASPDEIAARLAEKSKALIEAAKNKDKEKDKDKDKGAEKEKSADKDKAPDKDKSSDKDKGAIVDKDKQPEKEKTADKSSGVEKGETGGKDKPAQNATDGKQTKSWDNMSDAEKREALKANDPAAWEAFGKLTAANPSQAVAILSTKKGARPDSRKPDAPGPDLGNAIADAGESSAEQDTAPPPPPTPATPTPQPTTTEVEGGWLKDANGTTKVVYINDANGVRIGGYYVHYDKDGREIGRETFTETPNAPTTQQPAAVLSGRYQGRISGQSTGSITVTVSGSSVSGTVSGVFKGDSFHASFSGAINGDGSFSLPAQGVLQGNWGDRVKPYPFGGRVSGRVDGRTGSGSWSGKNQWGGDSGTWRATKG